MPVIAPVELDDLVSSGIGPRHAQRAHACFRTGRHKAHHLDGWHRVDDERGKPVLALGRRTEARAKLHGALDRRDDGGMRVTEDERPPRADVVDVVAAVGVDDVGPGAASDEARGASDTLEGPYRAVDSAGDEPLGLGEELLRAASHRGRRSARSTMRRPRRARRLCRPGLRLRPPASPASRTRPGSYPRGALAST